MRNSIFNELIEGGLLNENQLMECQEEERTTGKPIDKGPGVRADPGASGKPAVHVFDAERDALMEARVGGFSAQTGKGRVRLDGSGSDWKDPGPRLW